MTDTHASAATLAAPFPAGAGARPMGVVPQVEVPRGQGLLGDITVLA